MSERALSRYVRWLYSRFDVVFAPSRLMCGYLNSLGVRHTAHQPLGVDAEIFCPQRRTLDLRAKLGLPRGTRLLAYAGRFAGEKNVPVLLQAFAQLGKPYHLLLIGGGCEARPTHNITLLPYRRDCTELAQWLASADALVHAGTNETFGLVVLEAMACGRPVVSARAGAIPEIVDDEVGMLAAPGSASSMAEAIAALYERDIEAGGRRGTCARAAKIHLEPRLPVADEHLSQPCRRCANGNAMRGFRARPLLQRDLNKSRCPILLAATPNASRQKTRFARERLAAAPLRKMPCRLLDAHGRCPATIHCLAAADYPVVASHPAVRCAHRSSASGKIRGRSGGKDKLNHLARLDRLAYR